MHSINDLLHNRNSPAPEDENTTLFLKKTVYSKVSKTRQRARRAVYRLKEEHKVCREKYLRNETSVD